MSKVNFRAVFRLRLPARLSARLLAGLLAAALAACIPALAQARPLYRWVEHVPGGAEARAITKESACPTAIVDGRLTAMQARSEPRGAFPIRVCALPIPADAREVSLDGLPLPLPKKRVDRILLIGDTGCRLKGAVLQDCNDLSAWPFRLVADIAAADVKPDLVLHLGDLLYRETACPTARKGCAGSPFGDAWATWEADFFKPAEALLAAAPIVFVRGNHEDCARGGKGWSLLLDPLPRAADRACPGQANPYFVDLGGVVLLVFDVSDADEVKANVDQADWYRQQFAAVQFAGPGPVWLAFHKPIWALSTLLGGPAPGDNKTLALAARDNIPANVQAIFSGHQHTFQILTFEEDLPPQIVVGNSGDELLRHAPQDFDGAVINGVKVRTGRGAPGKFGFAILERQILEGPGDEWSLVSYDAHGNALAHCHLKNRAIACD
jgi:uncharacterized protein involved in tolerance to divalent cations